jgi:hypothetical protein
MLSNAPAAVRLNVLAKLKYMDLQFTIIYIIYFLIMISKFYRYKRFDKYDISLSVIFISLLIRILIRCDD